MKYLIPIILVFTACNSESKHPTHDELFNLKTKRCDSFGDIADRFLDSARKYQYESIKHLGTDKFDQSSSRVYQFLDSVHIYTHRMDSTRLDNTIYNAQID